MKFSLKSILGGVLALALFTACSKDDDVTPEPQPADNGLILINSANTDQGGLNVSVYAKDSLMAEYTDLYIKVKDSESGTVLTNATITITPMMDMGSMIHSAPTENPSGTAVNDMFEGAVVFTMPSEMGWTLEINAYDPAGDRGGLATIPVKVKAPANPRTLVVTPLDGSNSLVIAYVQPQDPKIGSNDFEITINRQESMMEFTPVDNFTVEMYPEMLAMGHSSPNNVNPTLTQNGHYQGSVNFTMSGDWRINLTLKEGETMVDSTAYFDVTF